jgi:hypothetical protein
MAGLKGRSGLPKGTTNNPAGKPAGAKNRVSKTVKNRIVEYVEKDFDRYISDLNSLEAKDRVKAVTELIKLIVPRPVGEEELEAIRGSRSAVLERMFPGKTN